MIYPKIFEDCVEIILEHEGGYVNHPNVPGGETNFGISKRSYPQEDIKNLTKDKAIAIYYRYYWTPMNLELLSDPNLILHLFDFGVNSGTGTAIKILQRLVGATPDGGIGQLTIKAIAEFTPKSGR